MGATNRGRRDWWFDRDDEGNRQYHIVHIVETDSADDGPASVMACSGLPIIGSYWAFGNEADYWAFCRPNMTIKKAPGVRENSPNRYWHVEQLFSTKPMSQNSCESETIEDPLLQPMTTGGSFTQNKIEAIYDKDNTPLLTPSGERIIGDAVTFDEASPTVRIGQNVASLGLYNFSTIIANPLNDAPLWGMPARCVKLCNVTWERKLYGACDFYYTRTFEFEINYNTWDKPNYLQGNKSLTGHWVGATWIVDPISYTGLTPNFPDPDDVGSYTQHKDRKGDNISTYYYDHVNDPEGFGAGLDYHKGYPWTNRAYPPLIWNVQKYGESNLLTLGIPTTL